MVKGTNRLACRVPRGGLAGLVPKRYKFALGSKAAGKGERMSMLRESLDEADRAQAHRLGFRAGAWNGRGHANESDGDGGASETSIGKALSRAAQCLLAQQ